MVRTSKAASLDELLAQSALPVDVEVVAHEAAVTEQTETSPLLPAGENLVAVVPDLGILDALLVVLPEPLYTTSALVLVPHVVTPCTLDATSHVVPVTIAHRLQGEEL